MEVAGNYAMEKGTEVERRGLVTPATRADIIENLISKDFIERDKKNLITTKKRKALTEIVEDNFKSAKTTAKWEIKLSDIALGKVSNEAFLSCIETEIKENVAKYQGR